MVFYVVKVSDETFSNWDYVCNAMLFKLDLISTAPHARLKQVFSDLFEIAKESNHFRIKFIWLFSDLK